VEGSEDIDRCGNRSVHGLLRANRRPHLTKDFRLILTVVEERIAVVLLDNVHELLKKTLLLRWIVGAERDHFFFVYHKSTKYAIDWVKIQ
jgi:hypothetical protein